MTQQNNSQYAELNFIVEDDENDDSGWEQQRNGSPASDSRNTPLNDPPPQYPPPPRVYQSRHRGPGSIYACAASIATNDPRNMFAGLSATEPSRIFAAFPTPEQSPPNTGGTLDTHADPAPSPPPNGAHTQRTTGASSEHLVNGFNLMSLGNAAAAQTNGAETPPAFGTALSQQQQNGSTAETPRFGTAQQQNGSTAETPRFGTAAEPVVQNAAGDGGTPHAEHGGPQGGVSASAQQSPSAAPATHPGMIPNPEFDATKPPRDGVPVHEQFGVLVHRPSGYFRGPVGNFNRAPRGHYTPNKNIPTDRHRSPAARSQQRNQGFRRNGSRPRYDSGGGGFGGGRRGDGRRGNGGFGTGANASAFDTESNAGDAGERRSRRRTKYEPDPVTEQYLFDGHIEPGANFQQYYGADHDAEIQVNGGDEQVHIVETFAEMGLDEQIMRNLRKRKYQVPTPIQKCVIPILMDEHLQEFDVMAHAQTGSGKTAAYLLPIIQQADHWKRENGASVRKNIDPYAVIIFPTRELAKQIQEDALAFNFEVGNVSIEFAIGQTDLQMNKNAIRVHGCDILCCTPGRFFHLLNEHVIRTTNVHVLVLDEADMQIENSWFEDVQRLKHNLPADHRTLLFSATYSESTQEAAELILRPDYFFCSVGALNGIAAGVAQEVEMLYENEKDERLLEILAGLPRRIETVRSGQDVFRVPKMIVFVNSKRLSDRIAAVLRDAKYMAESLNGDRDEKQRMEAWQKHKRGEIDIVVATDVCSRGLNIKDLDLVIIYDLPYPDQKAWYVHRIGRTGRCGHTGRAISFFEPHDDAPLAPFLAEQLTSAGVEVPQFLRDYAARVNDGTAECRFSEGLAPNDDNPRAWGAAPRDESNW